MIKKIFYALCLIVCCASLVYAGNMNQITNLGMPSDPWGSAGLRIYGGGSDCTCTISDGAHLTGLKCPGFYVFEQYNPTATTLYTYYAWFSPVSGKWKISSGSTGDSSTGYGIPTDSGFNIESSGADM